MRPLPCPSLRGGQGRGFISFCYENQNHSSRFTRMLIRYTFVGLQINNYNTKNNKISVFDIKIKSIFVA